MSGHHDSGFYLPGTSDHRRRAATDPSCDASGPSRVNHLEPARGGFSEVVNASGSNGNDPLVPELHDVGMNYQGESHMQVSAFTAVSQYPSTMDNETRFLQTSEVVNAVMERDFPQRGSSPGANAQPSSSSPPAELYMSDLEMGNALGDLSVPEPYAASEDVDMEAIVQQLIRNTAMGQNVSTIEQDTDDEVGGNLIMDYDPAMLRDMSTPSTPRDDDPDDTRKFYLDDEEDVGYVDRPQIGGPQLSDVDFDDFYRGFDHDSASQVTDAGAMAQEDVYSDGEGAGEDLTDNAHILASAVHITSMQSITYSGNANCIHSA